jgi:S1/P1 Nuclease
MRWYADNFAAGKFLIMQRRFVKAFLIFCFIIVAAVGGVKAWGTWGHQHINRAAVFALPTEMRLFFYNHIDFVTEESVIPDVRKYTINDKAEFARHYIDLELYQSKPADSIPSDFGAIKTKYPDSFLQKNGILPWYIDEMMTKLTKAFQDKRKAEILFISADLGHYIADAHMPLHTSYNHDGQLSNQKGIHSFWESQLPEEFGGGYNFHTGDAKFIPDVRTEIWRIIYASHALADTLLLTEKKLSAGFDQSKIYQQDSSGHLLRNRYNTTIHTKEYSAAYHDALHGMIERQLRLSIEATASFWYTAWVNAGRPDLGTLDPEALTERNRKLLRKDYKKWQKGVLFGFKIDNEY